MRDAAVLYFVVTALDGRRSSEWRVWTGRPGRPTDEAYVAPRSQAGRLKVSLHSDGSAQYGPTEKVRPDVRPGDRQALDRWRSPDYWINGWRPLFAVEFPDAELGLFATPPSVEARRAPTAGPGTAEFVIVLQRKPSASPDPPHGGRVLGRLSQASGTQIVVVTTSVAFDARTLYRADGSVVTPWWEMPPSVGGDPERVVLLGKDHHDGKRFATEISTARRQPAPIKIQDFDGDVRLWDERPRLRRRDNDLRFCALLRVTPTGRAELYIDTRARCNMDALGRDATRLLADVTEYGYDTGWEKHADGSWTTGLATMRVLMADSADGRGSRRPTDVRDL